MRRGPAITILGPPNVPLIRALWSLFDGIWGVLEDSWGVLDEASAPALDGDSRLQKLDLAHSLAIQEAAVGGPLQGPLLHAGHCAKEWVILGCR